jgi:hypothetical protein
VVTGVINETLNATISYAGRGDTTYQASATAPSVVGTYTATPTLTAGTGQVSNYKLPTSYTKDFEITAAGIDWQVTGASDLVYNGTAQTLASATWTDPTSGTGHFALTTTATSALSKAGVATGGSVLVAWQTTVPTRVDAGSYKLWYYASADNFSDSQIGSTTVSIAAATPEMTLPLTDTSAGFTYGTALSQVAWSNAPAGPVEDTTAGTFEWASPTTVPEVTLDATGSVTTSTANATYAPSSSELNNYAWSAFASAHSSEGYSFASGKLTFPVAILVNPATLGLSFASVTFTKTYDGDASATPSANPALTGFVNGDTSASVSLVATGVSFAFASPHAATGLAVTRSGDYALSGAKAADYNLDMGSSAVSTSGQISPKAVSLSWTGDQGSGSDFSYVYTGSAISPVASVTCGVGTEVLSVSYAYTATAGGTTYTATSAPTEVGTGWGVKVATLVNGVAASGTTAGLATDYTLEGVSATTHTFDITKAAATATAPSAASGLVYDAQAQTLFSAGTSQDGTLYYAVTSSATAPASTTATDTWYTAGAEALKRVHADTYYIWYYVAGDDNHSDSAISSTTITATIAPNPVVPVTFPTATNSGAGTTYGQALSSIALESGAFTDTTDPGASFAWVSLSAQTTYPTVGNAGFAVAFTPTTDQAGDYDFAAFATASGGTYSWTSGKLSATVTPQINALPVAIKWAADATATGFSDPYDGQAHVLTATVENVPQASGAAVNGDAPTLTVDSDKANAAQSAATSVGSYTAEATEITGGGATNYTLTGATSENGDSGQPTEKSWQIVASKPTAPSPTVTPGTGAGLATTMTVSWQDPSFTGGVPLKATGTYLVQYKEMSSAPTAEAAWQGATSLSCDLDRSGTGYTYASGTYSWQVSGLTAGATYYVRIQVVNTGTDASSGTAAGDTADDLTSDWSHVASGTLNGKASVVFNSPAVQVVYGAKLSAIDLTTLAGQTDSSAAEYSSDLKAYTDASHTTEVAGTFSWRAVSGYSAQIGDYLPKVADSAGLISAKTFSVSFSPTDSANFADATTDLAVTVVRATLVKTTTTPAQAGYFSAAGWTGSYVSGTSHGISVTPGSGKAGEDLSSGQGFSVSYSAVQDGSSGKGNFSGGNASSQSPTYTDVGAYTVYYKVTSDNYQDYYGSEVITITQAAPSVTWPESSTITYGQTLSESELAGGSSSTAVGDTDTASFAWASASAESIYPAHTNSGFAVALTPTALEQRDYDFASYTTGGAVWDSTNRVLVKTITLTVERATLSLDYSGVDFEKTYDATTVATPSVAPTLTWPSSGYGSGSAAFPAALEQADASKVALSGLGTYAYNTAEVTAASVTRISNSFSLTYATGAGASDTTYDNYSVQGGGASSENTAITAGTVKISPKALSLSFPTAFTKVWDGTTTISTSGMASGVNATTITGTAALITDVDATDTAGDVCLADSGKVELVPGEWLTTGSTNLVYGFAASDTTSAGTVYATSPAGGFTLSGDKSANYYVDASAATDVSATPGVSAAIWRYSVLSADARATITDAELGWSVAGVDATYEGTPLSLVSPTWAVPADGNTGHYLVSTTAVQAAPAKSAQASDSTAYLTGWQTSVPEATDAGSYRVWYYASAPNHADTALSDGSYVDVTIAKRKLMIAGMVVNDKSFDNTTTASYGTAPVLSALGSTAHTGVVAADRVGGSASGAPDPDKIGYTGGTPSFADAGVGTGILINFTTFSLTGSKVSDYELTSQPNTPAWLTDQGYGAGETSRYITASINTGFTAYKGVQYTTTALNEAGWTNASAGFTVTAALGYQVSLSSESGWTASLTFASDTATGSASFYVRNSSGAAIADDGSTAHQSIAAGEISAARTEPYKLDRMAPEPRLSYDSQAGATSAAAALDGSGSCTHFFDVTAGALTLGLSGSDSASAASGVAGVQYHLATSAVADPSTITDWLPAVTSATPTLSVEAAGSYYLYVRASDVAGNLSAVASERFCAFDTPHLADAGAQAMGTATSASASFTRTDTTDVLIPAALGANTVAGISYLGADGAIGGGDDVALDASDYSVAAATTPSGADHTIAFSYSYLAGLPAQATAHRFAISYKPGGLAYNAAGGVSDANIVDQTVSVTIAKAAQGALGIAGLATGDASTVNAGLGSGAGQFSQTTTATDYVLGCTDASLSADSARPGSGAGRLSWYVVAAGASASDLDGDGTPNTSDSSITQVSADLASIGESSGVLRFAAPGAFKVLLVKAADADYEAASSLSDQVDVVRAETSDGSGAGIAVDWGTAQGYAQGDALNFQAVLHPHVSGTGEAMRSAGEPSGDLTFYAWRYDSASASYQPFAKTAAIDLTRGEAEGGSYAATAAYNSATFPYSWDGTTATASAVSFAAQDVYRFGAVYSGDTNYVSEYSQSPDVDFAKANQTTPFQATSSAYTSGDPASAHYSDISGATSLVTYGDGTMPLDVSGGDSVGDVTLTMPDNGALAFAHPDSAPAGATSHSQTIHNGATDNGAAASGDSALSVTATLNITGAGEATVYVERAGDAGHNATAHLGTTFTLTVNKLATTVTLTPAGKVYDAGTEVPYSVTIDAMCAADQGSAADKAGNANISASGTAVFSQMASEGAAGVYRESGQVADKDVDFSDFALSGAKAADYELSGIRVGTGQAATTARGQAKIEPREVSLQTSGASVADKHFDGTATASWATRPVLFDAYGASSAGGGTAQSLPLGQDELELSGGMPTFSAIGSAASDTTGVAIDVSDFSLSGAAAANYQLSGASVASGSFTASILKGFTPVKGALGAGHYTTTTLNANGWTDGAFTVTADDGYLLSLYANDMGSEGGLGPSAWSPTLTFPADVADGQADFYVRRTGAAVADDGTSAGAGGSPQAIAQGEISAKAHLSYKSDTAAPTATIAYGTDPARAFLNAITFGVFFKETTAVTIGADDSAGSVASGIDSAKTVYSLTDDTAGGTAFSSDPATPYTGTFYVVPDKVYGLSAKVTDLAGNVSALSHEMVVLYSDASLAAGASEQSYTIGSGLPVSIGVELGANTLKSVSNATTAYNLSATGDYSASAQTGSATVSLSPTYLDSLSPGDYRLALAVNPDGLAFPETADVDAVPDSQQQTPMVLSVNLHVLAAVQTLSISGLATDGRYGYGAGPLSLSLAGLRSDGRVSWQVLSEVAPEAQVSDTVASLESTSAATAALSIHAAGSFYVRASVAATADYPAASVVSPEQTVVKSASVLVLNAAKDSASGTLRLEATVSGAASAGAPSGSVAVSASDGSEYTLSLSAGTGTSTATDQIALPQAVTTYTASYGGDERFAASPDATIAYDPAKLDQEGFAITDPGSVTYGAAPIQLTVTDTGCTAPVSFAAPVSPVLGVSASGLLSVLHAGSASVEASSPGDASYNEAHAVRELAIAKAQPSWSEAPTASAISYGQSLAASRLGGEVSGVATDGVLSGTLSFAAPLNTAPEPPTSLQEVVFTPASADYIPLAYAASGSAAAQACRVSLAVNPAALTVTQAALPTQVAGSALDLTGFSASVAYLKSGVLQALARGEWQVAVSAVDGQAYTGQALTAGAHSATYQITPSDAQKFSTSAELTVAFRVAASADEVPVLAAAPTATGLTYGESLSASRLSGGEVTLGVGGQRLAGSWSWAVPATIVKPESLTGYSAPAIFTPVSSAYLPLQVAVSVAVDAAAPVFSQQGAEAIAVSAALASDDAFTSVSMSDTAGMPVAGTFSWVDGADVPSTAAATDPNLRFDSAGNPVAAKATFTPSDSEHYLASEHWLAIDTPYLGRLINELTAIQGRIYGGSPASVVTDPLGELDYSVNYPEGAWNAFMQGYQGALSAYLNAPDGQGAYLGDSQSEIDAATSGLHSAFAALAQAHAIIDHPSQALEGYGQSIDVIVAGDASSLTHTITVAGQSLQMAETADPNGHYVLTTQDGTPAGWVTFNPIGPGDVPLRGVAVRLNDTFTNTLYNGTSLMSLTFADAFSRASVEVAIEVARGGQAMSGVVASSKTGKGVKAATLTLTSASGTEQKAQTSANGAYVFASVDRGSYTLVASHDGYTSSAAVRVQMGSSQQNVALIKIAPKTYKVKLAVKKKMLKKKYRKYVSKGKLVTYDSAYGKLPKPKRKHYKFKGWYTKKKGGVKVNASSTVAVAKNAKLYAHWRKLKLYIKIVKSVYLRKKPDRHEVMKGVVGNLKKGKKLRVTKVVYMHGHKKWYKVKYKGKTCYLVGHGCKAYWK